MLWIICLLSIVSANGNCANFNLCSDDQYLVPNAGNISCADEICGAQDISTCCGESVKRSNKASWNFLMIYLILLAVASVQFFLGYTLGSRSGNSQENEEKGGNNNTVRPKANIISPQEIEDEDAEPDIGRMYLL